MSGIPIIVCCRVVWVCLLQPCVMWRQRWVGCFVGFRIDARFESKKHSYVSMPGMKAQFSTRPACAKECMQDNTCNIHNVQHIGVEYTHVLFTTLSL